MSDCPDPNVQAIVDAHIERAKTGLRKYGTDTSRDDLTEVEWLRHLLEELMDAAVYTQRIISDRRLKYHEATLRAFLDANGDEVQGEPPEAVIRAFLAFVEVKEDGI